MGAHLTLLPHRQQPQNYRSPIKGVQELYNNGQSLRVANNKKIKKLLITWQDILDTIKTTSSNYR